MRGHHFDAGHEEFRAGFRTFLAREVVPHQEEWRAAGMVDRSAWLAAGKNNFLLPWAAEEYGGLGLTDLRYEQVIVEELARIGESGFSVPLHSAVIGPYLDRFGSDDQKRRHLTRAVSGETVLALAITEPDTGSDMAAIRTTATPDGDGWVLNGAKTFISNGRSADLVVVAARTESGEKPRFGLFLVDATAPGFARGRKLEKLGLRAQDTAELFFDNVRLPAGAVLGDPAGGLGAIMSMFARERLTVGMVSVAGAEASLQVTLDYVRQRTAFGRPVSRFQDTRFRLAAMRAEIDAGHALVDRAVLADNAGELTPAEAAAVKLFTSELFGRVADDCLQMHGGYGYLMEYPIARAYADARVQRIYGGTSEIMKEIIGRSMEL